ncbi:hypothetical protein ACLOAU_16670 [Niabella sp. CJ426]|uniref:hypothetical protein n=1 Tax=Niabella sp. CJ426 TaxID=3393740 RepID=UPI003CFCE3B9
MLFLLGVMGAILNWRQGIGAVGIIIVIYLFNRVLKVKWGVLAIIGLLGIISLSYIFDFSFIEVLLTAVGLSLGLFLTSSFKEIKARESVELFYLDSKKLKCLSTNDADYKGYALDPKNFLKAYDAVFIQSIIFKGNHLLISIGNDIIRPRELNQNDLKEIRAFLSAHFPHLLENEEAYHENLESENRFYLRKLLLFLPVVILGLMIYFFAGNGKNQPLTYWCLGLMVLVPFILFKILKKN